MVLISSVADLTDLGLNGFEIYEGFGAATGITKNGGGMEQCGHPDAGLVDPLAVFAGDLEILTDQTAGGNAAQADDDLGADQGHLIAQVVDTGILLGVQGIAILGRTALEYVCDIHVLSRNVDGVEKLIKKLTCSADKGSAAQILLLARGFTHEHKLRILVSNTENAVRSRLAKRALLTSGTFVI